MNIGKIYKISNNFDEKEYIGQTWGELDQRFHVHCSPTSKCLKLRNSIQFHGKEGFKIELLWEGECTQEELDEYEKDFIKLLDTMSPVGYNLREGGLGGRHSLESRIRMSEALKNPSQETRLKRSLALTGRIVTDETRRRLSESHMGNIPTVETRLKLSDALKGRTLTPEHCAKLRESRVGMIFSEEHKINLSISQTGRIVSEETRAKMSASGKGRVFTEKHKANLRESAQRRVAAARLKQNELLKASDLDTVI
jgi:group I intron endonuclease